MIKPRKGCIFYGWWIVLVAFVALTFTSMTGGYGFSLFYKRLIDYFGWSRTKLTRAISLSRLEAGFVGGIEGLLVDRFGPATIILIGVVLSPLGLLLLSIINSLLGFYLIFILLVTVGRSLSAMIAIDRTVANCFITRRGTAFGLLRIAVAVGAAGVIGVPNALVTKRRPEDYGLLPDGATTGVKTEDVRPLSSISNQTDDLSDSGADIKSDDIGMTVSEALRSSSFGFAIRLMVTGAATLHAIPLVEGLGYSKATAATVLGSGSMGMVSIVGRA